MSRINIRPWHWAVAVLAVATVIAGDFALAVHAVRSEFCGRFVEPYGYLCAEYRTYSADGYELVMHRIGTRKWQILDGSPVSDTISRNCKTGDQPFNSPGCLRLQAPSNDGGVPNSNERSAESRSVSSDDENADQNLPYQVSETPSSSSTNPYYGNEDKSHEQKGLSDEGPLWTDKDIDVSAYKESRHSDLLYRDQLKASIDRDQGPIQSSPESLLSDSRSEVNDRKGSSVSNEKAEGPQRSSRKVTAGPVSKGQDLPAGSEDSYAKKISLAAGPVYSPPGPSFADGPSVASMSETPDRSASVASPSLSPSIAPSEAQTFAAFTPSPSHDPDSEFQTGRSPVLLMHQEFMNGDSWFRFTDATDRLLPLLLVNAGFDVWIGHERATYWSHKHLHRNHTKQSYWNWTWDDHAQYDVPAILEYINAYTGFVVHYVGISQSASVGAAAATMPQSSRFMRSLILIGPTIYRGHTSSIVLDAWAYLFGSAVDQASWDDGYQDGAFNFSRAFPGTSIYSWGLSAAAMATISGPNCCLGSQVVSFTNGWDGTTSFKNLLHDQQGVRTNSWRHFDYRDPYNNTHAYGVPYAPSYSPEAIPTYIPVLVIYGGRDDYAPPSGVQYLLSRFATPAASVFLPAYAHYDLSYSVTRTQDVFIPILQFLEEKRWN